MTALDPAAMAGLIAGGATTRVEHPDRSPAFVVGQRITTDNRNPITHTRLPRYARGKTGEIVRVQGMFALPDSNALRAGHDAQYVYAVRFPLTELWGPQGRAGDSLTIDIWESYIADAG